MKTEFKWALIISFVNFCWLVAEYLLGFHDRYVAIHPYITLLSITIPILGIRKALIEKKLFESGKKLGFWKSMQVGALITVICAVISIFSIMLYFKFINPEYSHFMVEYTVDKFAGAGKDVAHVRIEAQKYYSLKSFMQKSFAGTMFIGLIISFVLALFSAKEK
ncbi:DUF4199 domain-containing protein [Solitalea lacus]|uniref:DUF4199 domain-containing protein n=1 Tax=Solitalea lacus TaxID=2911172 RepID=UPI001EDC321A|nr:DUF4199 domain-containing protein [Solitalea lacus]UKJ07864.1 DUF4199 domain-containing protein [Solitalea lacus]